MGSRGALRQGKRLLLVSQAGVWTVVFMAALFLSPPWLFSPLLRQTLAEHQLCTEEKTVIKLVGGACTVYEKAARRALRAGAQSRHEKRESSGWRRGVRRSTYASGGEGATLASPHPDGALGNKKNRVQIKIR